MNRSGNDSSVSMIKKAVQKQHNHSPMFYVVAGSNLYGFDDDDSDIDIRGVHVARSVEHTMLDRPIEQIEVNLGQVDEGFEGYEDMELVSYELRKFGKLLVDYNYNAVEWLMNGDVIMNGDTLSIDAVRSIIRDELPGGVVNGYLGMAKHNYDKYLNEDKEAYRPVPKKFLHVIRSLMAGMYAKDHGEIVSDIESLKPVLDDDGKDIVNDILARRESAKGEPVPGGLEQDGKNLCVRLFNELEFKNGRDITSDIDQWMQNVRAS